MNLDLVYFNVFSKNNLYFEKYSYTSRLLAFQPCEIYRYLSVRSKIFRFVYDDMSYVYKDLPMPKDIYRIPMKRLFK